MERKKQAFYVHLRFFQFQTKPLNMRIGGNHLDTTTTTKSYTLGGESYVDQTAYLTLKKPSFSESIYINVLVNGF